MERSQSVQLENSVVGIFGRERTDAAVEALKASAHEVFRLSGPGDTDKLAPNQGGLQGVLAKLAAALGDELQILEEISRALNDGQEVLIVRGSPEESADLSKRLREEGAISVWDFRGWTFAKTGEAMTGEANTREDRST